MRAWLLALAISTQCTVVVAEAPVREGPVERLVLDGGSKADAAAWRPDEGTVASDAKHVRRGDTPLRFHVDVDWEHGEPKYPIGWPRMGRKWPEKAQDWSAYDYLEFAIYVESSRTSLPATPMGFTLYGKEGRKDFNRALPELKLNQWTDIRLPTSDLPPLCTGMQFHISESNYKDGDKLDFWIDLISLVRYVEPTLTASRLAEGAAMSDSRYLTVQIALMGIKSGETADVAWALASAGKAAAGGTVAVPRGRNTVRLPLPAQGLPPGSYEVTLKCRGAGPPAYPLRIIASPWQEEPK